MYFVLICGVQSHVAEKQQASPQNLLAASGKVVFFSEERTHFFHFIHTQLC
jgi:hypothetical protein